MKTKASIVVMSHLSDAQENIGMGMKFPANNDINFAKYVMRHCNDNLNKEIDADALWAEFMKTPYYKG